MNVGTIALVAFLTVVVLLIVMALVLNKRFFKQLVIKFRGRTDEVMCQNASTPEGAADFYNNAIREKEELYARADRSFIEIAGKLENSERDLFAMKKEQFKITKEIEKCLDDNREDDAKQYAMRKITIDQKMEVLKETIEELKKAKDQQEEMRSSVKHDLDALKEEKERTVYQLEADQQIIALHEGMNAAASSNESDHMLERVREGARKQRERASGAQIAYDASPEAMNRRMEARSRDQEAENLIEQMKSRRGNK